MNRSYYAAPRCPGSLKEGFTTYNPATLRNVFSAKSVYHVLKDSLAGEIWNAAEVSSADFPHQRWFRVALNKNRLVPDKHGFYILKTATNSGQALRFFMDQPANEHLCMQLAQQIFEITTIPNALVFFPDGQPALIYKFLPEMKTFLSFENIYRKEMKRGINNYQQAMAVIDQFTAAKILMKERFFLQVVFSWLTTNAIAHMKFSGLTKTERGDYVIAPANTIQCTRMHELCNELALPGGLFEGDTNTIEFREYGHYTRNEFTAFALRSGLTLKRVEKIFESILNRKKQAIELIELAFLPEEAKNIFKFNFLERMERLS